MSFDLHNETVHLAHVNTRTEKHGDDDVLALDIRCELTTANAVLSKFSDSLKSVIYEKDRGGQEDLINPDHMPSLRNPLLGPLKWDLEMPSVQFRILHGEDDSLDTVFSGAKAGKFMFQCQEGGTVVVGFRIQVSQPDEAVVARLLTMLGKSVKVTLISEMVSLDDDEDSIDQDASDNVIDLFDMPAHGEGDEPSGQAAGETAQADEYDALYAKAVAFVGTLNRASISIVKRELKIDPLVAARILDQMEEEGIVAAANDQGLRDVVRKSDAVPA